MRGKPIELSDERSQRNHDSFAGTRAHRSGRWGCPAPRTAHSDRQSAGCSQRRPCPPKPDRPATDVGLRPDSNGEQQLTTNSVLQGYSTLDIADHLVISVHTVQSHLRNIFTKTGVRSRLVILLPRSSSPTTSRGPETTNSARQRICHCVAGRLVPPARVAAPARHRLSQQQGELSTSAMGRSLRADAGAEPTAAPGRRVWPPLTADAPAKQTLTMIRP